MTWQWAVSDQLTHQQPPGQSVGIFLCAELDQAVFTMAFHKLRTDPVQATSDFTAIIGVLVTVESFEQEHPLIRAEVNGFSGCRVCHEWIACSFLEWSVL